MSTKHGTVEIETSLTGEFFGWAWLIPPFTYAYDAITFEKSKIMYFDANAIKEEMENNQVFGYKIYKIFTPLIIENLKASRMHTLDLYDKSF